MRVAAINSVCGIGSTGKITVDLYNEMKRNGFESKIMFGRGAAHNASLEDAVRIGTDSDVNFHAVMSRLTDKHGFYSRRATKEMLVLLKALRPDVVHLHNIHGYYLNIELLFEHLSKENCRVIWTLHDCWAFTGHCAHFDFIGCDKWKTGCYACEQRHEYPKSLLIDNCASNYLRKKALFTSVKSMEIVTPSNWLSDIVRQSFLGKYPVSVINNGIDLELFSSADSDFRERHGISGKFIILGVASVWTARKGLSSFIRLAELLSDEFQIVMVGVNDKIRKMLPKNVIALPNTKNMAELSEIYCAADVFVNPTLEDNFPTTNLEALSCGTPVITYNTGGSVEIIDDTCGLIVEKNDIAGLKNAIYAMKADMPESGVCRLRAQKFDKEKMYAEYLRLYLGGLEG